MLAVFTVPLTDFLLRQHLRGLQVSVVVTFARPSRRLT